MVMMSLAAMARILVQETTTVSKLSSARDTLSGTSFSASLSQDVMMTDASQPCKGTFVWAGNDREQRQNHVDCPGLDWFLVHTERRIRLAH